MSHNLYYFILCQLFHIISYYLHYGNKHLLYGLNILYVLFSNVNTILVFQESFRMTNFTRVIITIQWNTKMCLMELAHHQPRLLDPLLHLLLHRHAFLQLRICGLYPYQISFAIWLGKTPGESQVYYIYYAYYLNYTNYFVSLIMSIK
jgi:hypothetical protein